jgi:hypothetical protein
MRHMINELETVWKESTFILSTVSAFVPQPTARMRVSERDESEWTFQSGNRVKVWTPGIRGSGIKLTTVMFDLAQNIL